MFGSAKIPWSSTWIAVVSFPEKPLKRSYAANKGLVVEPPLVTNGYAPPAFSGWIISPQYDADGPTIAGVMELVGIPCRYNLASAVAAVK
jgi:hypothetical protein